MGRKPENSKKDSLNNGEDSKKQPKITIVKSEESEKKEGTNNQGSTNVPPEQPRPLRNNQILFGILGAFLLLTLLQSKEGSRSKQITID